MTTSTKLTGEEIFALPRAFTTENDELLARIIDAVPDSWSDMSGMLEPSEVLVGQGQVIRDTGYTFHRFNRGVEIAHRHHPHPNVGSIVEIIRPDPVALLIEDRLPGFVSFNEIGFDASQQFQVAKRLAAGFVRKGYRGQLLLNNGRGREGASDMPANLLLCLNPWLHWEGIDRPRRPMPPTAVLAWDERHGGRADQLDAIRKVCEGLPLISLND